MLYFNYNGKLQKEDALVAGPDSRGLRYGDGLFETLKYKGGQLILFDEHMSRLWKGMNFLKFQPSKLFTPEMLHDNILQLLNKNKHQSARVRLSVIRSNGGLYDAKDHLPNYIIQSWPLAENNHLLNENGLQLCIYMDAKKNMDAFSNLKHNNYLPYFMGALFAKEQRCNDAIILNNVGNICDTTIANIFLINENHIYTPSLKEGCVAGTMRDFVIQQLKKTGYSLIETAINEADLYKASEVFLTNSIYNLRWVSAIGDNTYTNTITRKIFEQLHQTNPDVFC